jgi:DNA repair protein RecN (Recombination protein N)
VGENMLAQLKIKDFAIIDDVEIHFNEGMTVLTGETGSGKSIIIDAIGLLLGERAQSEMVRHDKEKAFIEGAFYYTNAEIENLLQEFGIESDDHLIIAREISKNGRNICRLNGHLVTVNQLKQLGTHLIDIHVQHDTTRLINTSNYLYLIDSLSDAQYQSLLSDYQAIYHAFSERVKQYQTIIKENKANQEKIDFYKFQLEEFTQAKIDLHEYQELTNKRNLIANYDKIYENLNKANTNIKEHSVLEKIYQSSVHLSKIAEVNETYQQLSENLLNLYYQLDDTAKLLNEEVLGLDYNPSELDAIEARLSIYSQLKRKYKVEIEALIELKNGLKQKINQIDHFDEIIQDLEEELKKLYASLWDRAYALRVYRQNLAEEMKEALLLHLRDLKLQNTSFDIIFNTIDENKSNYLNYGHFHETGFDEIDFHLSFNKGEPTKPLSKVASGGELSRFMLGLKTILTQKHPLSTMVFDEIDTGVSGITASAIANKIKSISKNTQVLCITHLPQVASSADHHLFIYKTEVNDRTNTSVIELDDEKRVYELAKMIVGDQVNDLALENAKNLLKLKG